MLAGPLVGSRSLSPVGVSSGTGLPVQKPEKTPPDPETRREKDPVQVHSHVVKSGDGITLKRVFEPFKGDTHGEKNMH
jgi:hypothetical protein